MAQIDSIVRVKVHVPELPEVEITCRGISAHVTGRTVAAVEVREPRLRWRIPEPVRELVGRTVRAVRRRGKYLVLDCGDHCLILHLGMSGSLRVLPVGTPPQKHDHFDLVFSDCMLRLRDPRRFGAVLWSAGPECEHRLLADLGFEPLSKEMDGARLHALTRGRRTSIKQFLMDGRNIVGVGNIYANESLFHAGIRPSRRAGSLSLKHCTDLVSAIKRTLRAAIHAGGSTLRDFVHSDGRPGYFQRRCSVYDRAGEPCKRCGAGIRRAMHGQRASFYCPTCQR